MDSQLRDLLDAAVGEPPHRVTPDAVRRRVRKRRLKEGVAAALAVLLIAGLGLTVVTVRSGPGPADADGFAAGVPPYYVQESFGGGAPVVRATATGAVTATIRCPWRQSHVVAGEIAATASQAFFLVCERPAGHGPGSMRTASRIYRFQLTDSGRVSGLSLVPGGQLGPPAVDAITAAPDGAQRALSPWGRP